MALIRVFAALLIFTSCASRKLEKSSQDELSHYIWTMTLVAPALNAAMGPLDPEKFEGVSRSSVIKLAQASEESFHPAKVYGKIHRKSLGVGKSSDYVELAKSLESPLWQKFSSRLVWLYGEEGSKEVERVMRLLDVEEYQLDMEKAVLAEKLSANSYNYLVVDILFSKTGHGAPGEKFLYRQSIFVATYLAVKDLSVEEIQQLEKVRSKKLYLKFKSVFESVVSGQYDEFFDGLNALYGERDAG